jgi:3-oxoacyl-[acyl-carrier-protein] synthase II
LNKHDRIAIKKGCHHGDGAITSLGNNLADYWTGLINGKSGIGLITHFDASRHACRIAGEVRGFDPHDDVDSQRGKAHEPFRSICRRR